ncbi:MAG: hypothetical protein GY768_09475 [Planctomycetaceae bacterium]|nr:hypothetical protein [Planctomycetaceae bacterium]
MESASSLWQLMSNSYRSCWKQLAATDILYKIIAFILLTPFVGLFFGILVNLSGRTVLADQDIVLFLLEPLGCATLILTGSLLITILALEQAALMQIIAAKMCGKQISLRSALKSTATQAATVVNVTIRLIAFCILIAIPFLLIAGLVYKSLLTEFDINFYLQEKPPVFIFSVAIGGILAVALTIILVWFISGWMLALPLAIFEEIAPKNVLRESQRRTQGKRLTLIKWLIIWLLLNSLCSAIASSLVGMLGNIIVIRSSGSLWLLVVFAGFILLLLSAANLLISLFSTTTFAVMLVHLYERYGGGKLQQLDWQSKQKRAAVEHFFRLSRKSFATLAMVGLIAAAFVGYRMLNEVKTEDHTEVTAHRGASASAPENTLAAIEQAIEQGTDWVEIDVQESLDGQVVVVHDSDLKKIGGSKLKIWESTAEQLRSVDIGSWFDPKFSDQRVPLLSEVLAICKDRVKLNIELKYYGHDQQLEQRVVDLVKAADMESDIVVMSLKQSGIDKIRQIEPDWTVGLLTAVAIGDLTRSNVDFLAVNTGLATRSFVRSAHNSDEQVYVWTVNDRVTMSTMIGRGIDNLITDKPALAKSVLKQRAELSTIERLMIEVASLLGASPATNQNIESF